MPDLLFETTANPVPDGILSGVFSYDGATADKLLRYAILKPKTRPLRGTVIVLQGRNEFIEKYYETMVDLSKRGFTAATFDWQGQGGSHRLLRNRLRGYVRRFDDYTHDLDYFLRKIVLPDCHPPFYILGHSSGALVALASMEKLSSRITRMVLCAPFMGLAQQRLGDNTVRRIASGLRWFGLGRVYSSGRRNLFLRPFSGNPLTSDPDRFTRNMEIPQIHPDLALGGATIRWLWGALDASYTINKREYQESTFIVPTLIIAAGGDRVVSTTRLERFASSTRNISLVTIDGAQHELLQEADIYRKQLWAAFDAFIPGSSDVEQLSETLEPDLLAI